MFIASRAIMAYLCNNHGDTKLYPLDPKVRAVVDQRLNFDMGTLNQRSINIMVRLNAFLLKIYIIFFVLNRWACSRGRSLTMRSLRGWRRRWGGSTTTSSKKDFPRKTVNFQILLKFDFFDVLGRLASLPEPTMSPLPTWYKILY